MNSRCLYCDKRLSLFHGKKKPFCSDAHEDLYMERQALSGLDRLKDNFFATGSPGPGRPPAAPSSPEPAAQFAYPELEPGFFDDDPAPPAIFNHPPQRSADGFPPPAEYMISSASVQAAPPSLPFPDPARAAFCALAWTRQVLIGGAALVPDPAEIPALLLESAPQPEPVPPEPVPPPLVTSLERLPMPLMTLANLPVQLDSSKISALPDDPPQYSIPPLESQPLAIEPEPPPLITSLVFPTIAPFRVSWPDTPKMDAPRMFRDCPLDMALPAPVCQPYHHELKFVAAPSVPPPCDVSPQPGPVESLPAPQPLRFRMLLDLRVMAFETSTYRLFPAPLAPLGWNAAPPEALDWSLVSQRRRPGPMLPQLVPVLCPQERYL